MVSGQTRQIHFNWPSVAYIRREKQLLMIFPSAFRGLSSIYYYPILSRWRHSKWTMRFRGTPTVLARSSRPHIGVNWAAIESDNSLSLVLRQTITWISAGVVLAGTWEHISMTFRFRSTKVSLHKNIFENAVYKIVAVLNRPKCFHNMHKPVSLAACRKQAKRPSVYNSMTTE